MKRFEILGTRRETCFSPVFDEKLIIRHLAEIFNFYGPFDQTRYATRTFHRTRRVFAWTRRVTPAGTQNFYLLNGLCVFLVWLLYYVCRNMFFQGQSSQGSQGDHPWLNFPRIESKSTMTKLKKKLAEIRKKDIYVPNAINWEWLGEMHYEEELAPYLIKNFMHNGVSISCDGWSRVFRMQEPVYQELCWEFFSIITFWGGNDYYNPGNITFCLGKQVRHCSMVELAWGLWIYD